MTEENGGPKPDRVGRRPKSREMAGRDLRIMDMVAAGMRVSEIALRERLSKRRIRELIARNLAERERLPPPQFFELQTRRLSEALLVAYAKMNDGNLARISHRRGLVFRDPTMIAQWPWRGRARPWRGLRGWGRSFGGLRWVVGWIAAFFSASRRRVRRL